MVREFSNFGTLRGVAKKLVDNDDLVLSNKLYINLNSYTTRVFVSYNPDFWSAYNLAKKYSEPIMIATKIMLYNQNSKKNEGYHAVCILKEGRMFYLLDPNGYMDAREQKLIYTNHTGKPIEGSAFSKKYKISLPKHEGIQSIAPGYKKIPKGYINKGGYCMFYLYIGMINILQIYETSKDNLVEICKSITDTESLDTLLEYFPEDIHLQTKNILEDIFTVQ